MSDRHLFPRLRWLGLAWLVIYLPSYAAAYGFTNFLFLCNLGVMLTAAAVAFAAVAAADLPPGLSGLETLEPGSGRALLQGGLAALFGGWLAVRALERWRHLAG